MVTNWSVRLEKHKTIEILLMVDFLCIFKMLNFQIFSRFFQQYFLMKLLNALIFLNTVCQTQENLISPFLAIIVLQQLYTSGVNVRVKKSIW